MKIFYSWQSDSPNRVNRAFIKKAAQDAIDELNNSQDFVEADRPVTLDQDTKGVLGSPPIADTIFEKIELANIVLADVTITGETAQGKKQINSNVAVELGFAIGSQGYEPLLKVMNTFYGSPEELPFDLKHRRWPVQYCLPPDASSSDLKKVRATLTKAFVGIFTEYLSQATKQTGEMYKPFSAPEVPGFFWKEGEVLVPVDKGSGQPEYKMPMDTPALFLRIWPETELKVLSSSDQRGLANKHMRGLSPIGGGSIGLGRNRWGTSVYAPLRESGELEAISQIFKNGELWSACFGILQPFSRTGRPEDAKKTIPSQTYEQQFRRILDGFLRVAWDDLGYTDRVHVAAGIVNSEGYYMGMGQRYVEQLWGPILDDHVIVETFVVRGSEQSRDNALMEIFEKVFDAVGEERPLNLNGFSLNTT